MMDLEMVCGVVMMMDGVGMMKERWWIYGKMNFKWMKFFQLQFVFVLIYEMFKLFFKIKNCYVFLFVL